jgi:twitching motility protein PilT
MINILDLLQDAEKMDSYELRLASGPSGQVSQARTRKGWHPISTGDLGPSWMREQLFALLDEEQRVSFAERGVLEGHLQNQSRIYNFVMSRTTDGFHAYFFWDNANVELTDFALPPSVFEIIKRSSGVHVICGPRRSGRSTLARLIAESEQAVAVFCDNAIEYSNPSFQVFPVEHLGLNSNIVRGFDLVVIDSQRPQAWRQAITLAESETRVLLVLPYPEVQMAIERLSEKVDANPAVGRARISSVVQLILNLRLIPAVDKGLHAAFELLLLSQEIRRAVQHNNWQAVEEAMSVQGEKTGMRTMNQCLMSLMLKRKIDLKVGFSESPHPEQLNQMLEKVGF